MSKHSTFFVGLDLGDKVTHLVILNQEGELIEETRLPTTGASFQRKFSIIQTRRVTTSGCLRRTSCSGDCG